MRRSRRDKRMFFGDWDGGEKTDWTAPFEGCLAIGEGRVGVGVGGGFVSPAEQS